MKFILSSSSIWLLMMAGSTSRNVVLGQGDGGCIDDLNMIYANEQSLLELVTPRSYTLCPNTVYTVGIAQEDGSIVGGSLPLALRSNASVKCGDDGSSANNCVIDGLGSTGVFIAPSLLFNDGRIDNIRVQGLTIDSFLSPPQIPVFVGGDGGSLEFVDCIYSNNRAEPFFLMDEHVYTFEPPENQPPEQRRELLDGIEGLTATEEAQRRASLIISNHIAKIQNKEGSAPPREDIEAARNAPERRRRRKLLATSLSITFDSCVFHTNDNVEDPGSSGGLTMLRFRGADFYNLFWDIISNMDVNILNCVFRDNRNQFATDTPNVVRSFIDFYSTGTLRLENNCFENNLLSETGGSDYVLTQVGSTVNATSNYITPANTTNCPFVAEWTEEYIAFVQCNAAVADAATCTSGDTPSPTPFPPPAPSAWSVIITGDQPVTVFTTLMTWTELSINLIGTAVENNVAYTAVVPIDSAFDDIDPSYLNLLLTDPVWIAHARCVAAEHLLYGALETERFLTGRDATSFDFVPVPLNTDPVFSVGSAILLDGATNIDTSTGIVHYATTPVLPNCVSFSLYDFLSFSETHTILVELVDIAGLTAALQGDALPLTILAPNDEAFSKIPPADLEALKADPAAVNQLLLYHAVGTNLFLFPTPDPYDVETTEGSSITVSTVTTAEDVLVVINDEAVVEFGNLLYSNGMFHSIDTVLTIPTNGTIPPGTIPPGTMPPGTNDTMPPATIAPATMMPGTNDTMPPATMAPATTTMPPATMVPNVTMAPATMMPEPNLTMAPATMPPATMPPVTMPPVTVVPGTMAPVTLVPVTDAPVVAPTPAPVPAPTAAPVPAATDPPSAGMTASMTTMVGVVVAALAVFMM